MSAVARRYAKALFALAKEAGTLEQTAAEIGRVAAVANDPTIGPVLGSPLLSPVRRRELVQMLARELSLSTLLTRFLGLLAEHRRLDQLPAIATSIERLVDDEMGRVRIRIRSAAALSPQEEQTLVAAFSRLTGKHVVPQVATDAELLGGIIVEVEGTVYDGSVRTQFDRLAKTLVGTAAL
jgi:F-type H+-transporting ATPase subunit delta